MIGQILAPRLGDLLIEDGLVTEEQLTEALDYHKASGGRLGSCLVELGHISEDDIATVLARQYGIPAVNPANQEIEQDIIDLLTYETARKYEAMPLDRQGTTLSVAMVDPINVVALDELRFMTGFSIEAKVAPESQIREAIGRYYSPSTDGAEEDTLDDLDGALPANIEILEEEEEEIDLKTLAQRSEETPTLRLVNAILLNAVKRGASDVHIEPYEKEFRVRFRVDGQLQTGLKLPVRFKDAITSRVKIMAKLDITERRRPQDGRIKIRLRLDGKVKDLDFRVSTVPTLCGEKVVLRLLDRENLMLDMRRLGFEPESLECFAEAIAQPFGMVLATGPTGSGKTNTLYSAISQINSPDRNIMTVEDPVEYNLRGINQVQVNEQVGSSFANVLRSFLRQDPDVILVGEIRDLSTAEIAVKASLTGHLVLSTLHTNDAASAVARLLDMGIPSFLVATSVRLICAQRLVRRLCDQCKKEVHPPKQSLVDLGYGPEEAESLQVFQAVGCAACNKMGYKGRVGLYEVMEVNDELKELIMRDAPSTELTQQAVANGMITLRRSGLTKVGMGQTTLEEVLRETIQQ